MSLSWLYHRSQCVCQCCVGVSLLCVDVSLLVVGGSGRVVTVCECVTVVWMCHYCVCIKVLSAYVTVVLMYHCCIWVSYRRVRVCHSCVDVSLLCVCHSPQCVCNCCVRVCFVWVYHCCVWVCHQEQFYQSLHAPLFDNHQKKSAVRSNTHFAAFKKDALATCVFSQSVSQS